MFNFKFNAFDIGQPTQYIKFEKEGEEPVKHPIPDIVVPDDLQERFWFLHGKLKEAGLISDIPTTLDVS